MCSGGAPGATRSATGISEGLPDDFAELGDAVIPGVAFVERRSTRILGLPPPKPEIPVLPDGFPPVTLMPGTTAGPPFPFPPPAPPGLAEPPPAPPLDEPPLSAPPGTPGR